MKWMNLFSVNPVPRGPTYSDGYQQTRWDQTVKVDNGLYQALFLAVNLDKEPIISKQKPLKISPFRHPRHLSSGIHPILGLKFLWGFVPIRRGPFVSAK